jgi:hypothetical protein
MLLRLVASGQLNRNPMSPQTQSRLDHLCQRRPGDDAATLVMPTADRGPERLVRQIRTEMTNLDPQLPIEPS